MPRDHRFQTALFQSALLAKPSSFLVSLIVWLVRRNRQLRRHALQIAQLVEQVRAINLELIALLHVPTYDPPPYTPPLRNSVYL